MDALARRALRAEATASPHRALADVCALHGPALRTPGFPARVVLVVVEPARCPGMGDLCSALLAHAPRAVCWVFESGATGSPTIRALTHDDMDALSRGEPPRAWQPPTAAGRAALAARGTPSRTHGYAGEGEPAVVATVRPENPTTPGPPPARVGDTGSGGGPRGLADVLSDEELAMLLATGPVVSNDPLNEVRARPV